MSVRTMLWALEVSVHHFCKLFCCTETTGTKHSWFLQNKPGLRLAKREWQLAARAALQALETCSHNLTAESFPSSQLAERLGMCEYGRWVSYSGSRASCEGPRGWSFCSQHHPWASSTTLSGLLCTKPSEAKLGWDVNSPVERLTLELGGKWSVVSFSSD